MSSRCTSTLTIKSFLASSVLPSLEDVRSRSSNKLPKSSSLSEPMVLCSILRSTLTRSSKMNLLLPLPFPRRRSSENSSEGFKKYPSLFNASSRIAARYSLPWPVSSRISRYLMPFGFRILSAYRCIRSLRYL